MLAQRIGLQILTNQFFMIRWEIIMIGLETISLAICSEILEMKWFTTINKLNDFSRTIVVHMYNWHLPIIWTIKNNIKVKRIGQKKH